MNCDEARANLIRAIHEWAVAGLTDDDGPDPTGADWSQATAWVQQAILASFPPHTDSFRTKLQRIAQNTAKPQPEMPPQHVHDADTTYDGFDSECLTCEPSDSKQSGAAPELSKMQAAVWANKIAKEFNTTDVPLEICLLQGEIAELFDEWRKSGPGVADEMADVAIYMLGLAQMLGVDLQVAVIRKMQINAGRRYVDRQGALVKATDAVWNHVGIYGRLVDEVLSIHAKAFRDTASDAVCAECGTQWPCRTIAAMRNVDASGGSA